MLKGYAVNEKRLEALNKTVEIQSRMISSLTETSEDEVYEVVKRYTEALTLLDGYDHQCLNWPEGTDTIYRLSYEECRKLIDSMALIRTSSALKEKRENWKGFCCRLSECLRNRSLSFDRGKGCQPPVFPD